jgi:hypothetical protein
MDFVAKLLQNGRVIADRVTGTLDSAKDGSWYGYFNLPPNYLIHSGAYRVELDDGRSGEIELEAASSLSFAPIRVPIRGTGPLA